MDFSSITLDTASVLSLALVVVGGYAAIWAVNKVISVMKK